MEDIAATISWMLSTSGLDGAAASVASWIAGIDWTPLIVLVGVAAACYVAYVLLDESL